MALVTCPDCRAQVSDQAPSCIHCGRPMHAAATVSVPPPTAPESSTLWAPQPAPSAKPCPTCGTHNRPNASHCVRCGRMLMEPPPAYVDYNERPPVPTRVEDEEADTARALASAAIIAAFVGIFTLRLPMGAAALGLGIAANSKGDNLGTIGMVLGVIEIALAVLALAGG